MTVRVVTCVVWAALCGTAAQAQWPTYKAPGVPRTQTGDVNLAAPPPRASDGKPDSPACGRSPRGDRP